MRYLTIVDFFLLRRVHPNRNISKKIDKDCTSGIIKKCRESLQLEHRQHAMSSMYFSPAIPIQRVLFSASSEYSVNGRLELLAYQLIQLIRHAHLCKRSKCCLSAPLPNRQPCSAAKVCWRLVPPAFPALERRKSGPHKYS